MHDLRIFIDAALNLARVDIYRHQNYVSNPYRSDFNPYRTKCHMFLCVIFIDATLNNPARVATFRHQNHVSSPYRSDFSPLRSKWPLLL